MIDDRPPSKVPPTPSKRSGGELNKPNSVNSNVSVVSNVVQGQKNSSQANNPVEAVVATTNSVQVDANKLSEHENNKKNGPSKTIDSKEEDSDDENSEDQIAQVSVVTVTPIVMSSVESTIVEEKMRLRRETSPPRRAPPKLFIKSEKPIETTNEISEIPSSLTAQTNDSSPQTNPTPTIVITESNTTTESLIAPTTTTDEQQQSNKSDSPPPIRAPPTLPKKENKQARSLSESSSNNNSNSDRPKSIEDLIMEEEVTIDLSSKPKRPPPSKPSQSQLKEGGSEGNVVEKQT